MAFCLLPELAQKMKKAIKDGTLNPDILTEMTSKGRRQFFAKIIGENEAKEVNLAFEKKLLLKNRERAMYEWAKDITGLSKIDKEALMTKIRQTYADKKRRLYEPDDHENFLNEITADLYSKKYKTDISLEEAEKITKLASEVLKAKSKMNEDFTWGNGSKADRIKYGMDFGAAKVVSDKYIGELKQLANKPYLINPLKAKGIIGKLAAIGEDLKIAFNFVADNSRSLIASVDNSLWFRQGIKTLTNPKYTKIWAKRFGQSFVDIARTLKGGVKEGEAIIDAVKAEIYSRPNYLNGRYEMGHKLDVGVREEIFPTSFPQKIPILGRIFKASEVAYESGAMRLRADIADKLYALAEKQGLDMNDKFEIGSINKLVNSLTGRGSMGVSEGGQAFVNRAFFSVKFFKSNLDFLTFHAGSKISSFARWEAAKNLLTTTATLGATMSIIEAVWPDAIEWDPRSSNFGKIKIGNTVFDITGGMGGIVTVVSRIARQSTKSAITGIVAPFGEKYGAPTGMEVFWNFTEGKFSPMFSLVKDLIDQQDFQGEPISMIGEIKKLITPIIAQQGIETYKDPESAPLLLTLIADGLGLGVSSRAPKKSEAEKLFEEISDLEPTEQAERIKELKETDPAMYKKVQDAEKDFMLGIDPTDKAIRNMQIEDGTRAIYIYKEVEKLETPAEKNAYIENLINKKIINTKKGASGSEILKQLEEIRDAGGSKEYLKEKAKSVNSIDGVADLIVTYAKAYWYDPGSAFITMFTREQLEKIEGDTVIMKREVLDSEAIKKFKEEMGFTPEDEVELDHIIDRQLGGRILDEDNWQVLTEEEHDKKTEVSNYLRGLLWSYKITEEQANTALREYLDGKSTFEQIKSKYK